MPSVVSNTVFIYPSYLNKCKSLSQHKTIKASCITGGSHLEVKPGKSYFSKLVYYVMVKCVQIFALCVYSLSKKCLWTSGLLINAPEKASSSDNHNRFTKSNAAQRPINRLSHLFRCRARMSPLIVNGPCRRTKLLCAYINQRVRS